MPFREALTKSVVVPGARAVNWIRLPDVEFNDPIPFVRVQEYVVPAGQGAPDVHEMAVLNAWMPPVGTSVEGGRTATEVIFGKELLVIVIGTAGL